MPPAGFQPTIPASEIPQTHVLDHPVSGIGPVLMIKNLTETAEAHMG
jgi:hypothetical protein